jgi:hypothetical protein
VSRDLAHRHEEGVFGEPTGFVFLQVARNKPDVVTVDTGKEARAIQPPRPTATEWFVR